MSDLDRLTHMPYLAPQKGFMGRESFARQITHWLLYLAGTFISISIFVILLLRWVNPPASSFMLQRQFEAQQNEENLKLQYQWVDWENISPQIKMAAITSEDQGFATHWGLDLDSIQQAIKEYERGEDLRGASTITQQTAKNLFLWPGQSYLRKGIETYFALLLELFWSKERILEVYLNIVEFGDGIYGVQSAAQHYFNTTAANLSKWESAFMVTALPAPKRYNLADPSEYMLERSAWVMRYMDYLGNSHYLNKIR